MKLYKLPYIDKQGKTRHNLAYRGVDGIYHPLSCCYCGEIISDRMMTYRNPNGTVKSVPVLDHILVRDKHTGLLKKSYCHRHCKIYKNPKVKKGDGYANVRGRCWRWGKRR